MYRILKKFQSPHIALLNRLWAPSYKHLPQKYCFKQNHSLITHTRNHHFIFRKKPCWNKLLLEDLTISNFSDLIIGCHGNVEGKPFSEIWE